MQKFRKRILLLYVIVAILMMALIGRLFYIQVIQHDELEKMARDQQNKEIPIPAKRGDIVDRNGDKMAFSVTVYSIYAQKPDISKPVETAKLVADTLGLDSKKMADKLIDADTIFVRLASGLSKEEADRIKAKGIYGISITEDTKRVYPYNNLASHVLGAINADLNGMLGVESEYNDLLKGKAGAYYVTTDRSGRQLAYGDNKVVQPVNGYNLQLTIDDTIQYFVEQRLEESLEAHEANSAAAIVMNPKTGEILAMANKPDFDPNTPMSYEGDYTSEEWSALDSTAKNDYLNKKWKNITLSNVYEPGSVFKTVTASIGLEEGLVTPDEVFNESGIKYVAGVPLKCWIYPYSHGKETFVQALENSCNPVFMDVIDRIGAPLYYTYLEKFGVFEKTNIDLPTEINSVTYKLDGVGPVELATMSYGHGNAYTMIQVISAISAVVNGGNLMVPHVVDNITDDQGEVIQTFEPKVVRRVISEETSATMRMMMEKVVGEPRATGHNAYIEGIRMGGKTGSTRKFMDGAYQENKVYASFVGVVPIDDPQFIILAVVDEPQDMFGGGSVAAPLVKSIYEDILRYEDILPEETDEQMLTMPSLVGLTYKEASEKLDKLGLTYSSEPLVVEDETLKIVNQFPAAESQISKHAVVILSVGDE